jgi:hypothetical protein
VICGMGVVHGSGRAAGLVSWSSSRFRGRAHRWYASIMCVFRSKLQFYDFMVFFFFLFHESRHDDDDDDDYEWKDDDDNEQRTCVGPLACRKSFGEIL